MLKTVKESVRVGAVGLEAAILGAQIGVTFEITNCIPRNAIGDEFAENMLT